MSKHTKRKTIPEAPVHISRQINRLAEIREIMKGLMEKSKDASKKIIAFGSCHNEDWRAYVKRSRAGTYSHYRKAHESVTLKPVNEK